MAVSLEVPTNGEVYFAAITVVVSITLQDWIKNNYNKADGLIKKFIALTWSVIGVILLSIGLFFIYDIVIVLSIIGMNLIKALF
ncbi:hypothetical protein [Methanosarcina siciliae]|uniref:hypothetical protein n=1 Tax=Methanosarcina siciliae TaxID=38027 RepID=UPI00064FC75E|nr:hypothetical protein [Methanosarcina siciliae]